MGPRSNLATSEDSQPMISYTLVTHPKPLGTIISELQAQFGHRRLTLKEGSKVHSDHIRRFPGHDLL